jgi:hypothetical protein
VRDVNKGSAKIGQPAKEPKKEKEETMKETFAGGGFRGITGTMLLVLMTVMPAPAPAASIIDEWGAVTIPAPPQLREVKLPAPTTALLLLDFNRQVCNIERRPRCVASVPAVSRLLRKAREKGALVVYSLTMGASVRDVAPELAARPGDPVVTSGPDKFIGTELEKILRDRRIKTVIVTGTAAHGAVISTAGGDPRGRHLRRKPLPGTVHRLASAQCPPGLDHDHGDQDGADRHHRKVSRMRNLRGKLCMSGENDFRAAVKPFFRDLVAVRFWGFSVKSG